MKIWKLKDSYIAANSVLSEGDVTYVKYVAADANPDTEKYDDDTTITSWDMYGLQFKDYLYVRNEIMVIAATTGFSNLSTAEKEISSKHFTVNSTDRDTVHSDAEQQINWNVFVHKSVECRATRWEEAKGYISYVLPPADSIDLAKSSNELSQEYLIYGIEDNASDGIDGLFDYLEGTSSYVGLGYPAKSYWAQVHQDRMMDILRNGNY